MGQDANGLVPRVSITCDSDGIHWFYVLIGDDYGLDHCSISYGPLDLVRDGLPRSRRTEVGYLIFCEHEVSYDTLTDDEKAFVWELYLS